MVALHQHADGVKPTVDLELARGGAHAALERVADHALAAAYVALGKVRARVVDGSEKVFGTEVAPLDVVEPGVVTFADDGVDRGQAHAVPLAAVDHVADHGVVDAAHVERVGQGDGRLDRA